MHWTSLERSILIFFAATGSASLATADGAIDKIMTPAERIRLAVLDSIRAEAIAKATKSGVPREVATHNAVLAGKALSFSGEFGERRVRLDCPSPQYESKLDILELKR